MRVVLSLAIGAVLLATLFWLRMVPESSPVASHAPGTQRESSAAQAVAPDPAREAVAIKAVPAPAASANGTGPAAALHGTLVVVDAAGREHRETTGTFKLYHTTGGEWQVLDVELRRGQWRANVTAKQVIAADITLDEREALAGSDAIDVPASQWLELRARWPRSTSLHVRDRDSRVDLAGVDLWIDAEWLRGSHLYPMSVLEKPEATQVRSPIELPFRAADPVYWLHVRGYAWSRIQIAYHVGGEREVLLERGGTLTLELRNRPAHAAVVLALSGEEHRMSWRREVHGTDAASVVLDDLKPGAYRAVAEVDGRVLGESTVTLRAGDRLTVPIVLQDSVAEAPRPVVPLQGVVILPQGLARDGLSLVIYPLREEDEKHQKEIRLAISELADVPGRASTWHFDAGRVLPMAYVAVVDPLQVHAEWSVGVNGELAARIEVQAFAEVVVRVADRHSGERIGGDVVSWRRVGATWRKTYRTPVPWDGERQAHHVRVPLGSVEVTAWPDGYAAVMRELAMQPGVNEITIEVEREQYIRIIAREGDANVPINPGDHEFMVRALDGGGESTGWQREYETGTFKISVSKPGTYLVTAPVIAGFEPIPEREVRVAAGETAEVVYDLRHK